MKLVEQHRSFLREKVNLNATRLDLLQSRVESIYAALADDDTLGGSVLDYVKQGSWAHRTIIRPVQATDEFDADILLVLREQPDWQTNKKLYITETLAALRRSPYRDMVEKHTRCVRVTYADDCHVDVVPYVDLEDGQGVIVNSTSNEFESSDPSAFADWMKEKDDLAGGNLRKVIRLIKYLRDFKGTFSAPSVILTTLLGERVIAWDSGSRYPDSPTALKHLLSDLDDWLQLHPIMPVITDPSCPDVTFNHRWDQDRYANFRSRVQLYSAWIDDAFDEPDRDTSIEKWRRVFGDDFGRSTSVSAALAPSTASGLVPPYVRAPDEQMIQERGFTLGVTHTATIHARVTRLQGFRHGALRGMGSIGKGRQLEFRVQTDVAPPYAVFWKVRNFGPEAEALGQLRGRIETGESEHTKTERTRYAGDHWVECYVVKDRVVRATDRHLVRIR